SFSRILLNARGGRASREKMAFGLLHADVCSVSKATELGCPCDVRFTPHSDCRAQERWHMVNAEARQLLDLRAFQLICDNLPGLGAPRLVGAAIRGTCCWTREQPSHPLSAIWSGSRKSDRALPFVCRSPRAAESQHSFLLAPRRPVALTFRRSCHH